MVFQRSKGGKAGKDQAVWSKSLPGKRFSIYYPEDELGLVQLWLLEVYSCVLQGLEKPVFFRSGSPPWFNSHVLADSFHLPFLNKDFFSSAHPAIFPFLNFSACLEVPRIYFRLPYIYDISLISIYMLFSTLQPPPLPFSDNFFLPPILWLVLIVSGNDVCYDTLCAINIYLILPAWLVHLRAGIMILLCNTELSFIQKAFNIFIFWVNK